MSHLRVGDERMHHSDHSHRWTAPPNVNQDDWVVAVRVHLEEHRATMGGSADVHAALARADADAVAIVGYPLPRRRQFRVRKAGGCDAA